MIGSSFVQTLVMGYWSNPQATTSDLNQAAGTVGIQISRQGIDQRYGSEAAAVLKRVLEVSMEKMLSVNPVNLPVLRRFNAVRIEDSSTITLPAELEPVWSGCGSKVSSLKLSVDWDLKSGQLNGSYLADGRRHDQTLVGAHREVKAGEVVLRDDMACSHMLARLCQTLRTGCKMGRSANSLHTFERLLAFESLSLKLTAMGFAGGKRLQGNAALAQESPT